MVVGAGATVSLSGAANVVVTADSTGNFVFTNLANGDYTVTPSKPGTSFTPTNKPVSVSGANLTAVNFVADVTFGTPTVDTQVWDDQSKASAKITSPTFSTNNANELLLAFVAADYKAGANTTVKTVSGAGLTWTLVQRTNTQKGTAEIWRAFAPSTLRRASGHRYAFTKCDVVNYGHEFPWSGYVRRRR